MMLKHFVPCMLQEVRENFCQHGLAPTIVYGANEEELNEVVVVANHGEGIRYGIITAIEQLVELKSNKEFIVIGTSRFSPNCDIEEWERVFRGVVPVPNEQLVVRLIYENKTQILKVRARIKIETKEMGDWVSETDNSALIPQRCFA